MYIPTLCHLGHNLKSKDKMIPTLVLSVLPIKAIVDCTLDYFYELPSIRACFEHRFFRRNCERRGCGRDLFGFENSEQDGAFYGSPGTVIQGLGPWCSGCIWDLDFVGDTHVEIEWWDMYEEDELHELKNFHFASKSPVS
jgi:hypothetical protein